MRILIVTQYIYPETFKSSDMAFELAKRGYEVDVLTGIPNYPEGKYFKGYGLFKKRREVKGNVHFYRCFQTPRKLLPGLAGLALNYLTFVISGILWILGYFVWKKRYDVIITHEPSPITQIIPAIILGKLRGVPVYSWIMDIWPDSVTSHLPKKIRKFFHIPLNAVTNWIYKNSDKILITSPGFKEFINRDFDYSDKIIFFPNWSDDIVMQPISVVPEIPNGYIIMMAGNIGSGLGIPNLLSLIKECRNLEEVYFVFVGGGSCVEEMQSWVKDNNLSNVLFMGRHPFEKMHSFYVKADAMLLSLAPVELPFLQATIPARLQSYMSAGKPILGMIDGGAAKEIRDYDMGYCAKAGDYKDLTSYIMKVVLENKELFKQKGYNARKRFEEKYTMQKCIDNLENILKVNY